MPDLDQVDAVVIGAGVVGASCAYHLSRRGLSVAVVEARGGPAEASTGLSFASVRAQWADEGNIEISWRSIQFWRELQDDRGIDVGYRPTGYLMLFPPEAWEQQLRAVELQRERGVPVEVISLERAQTLSRFDAGGLAGATWCPSDGQVDPHGATVALLTLAKQSGASTHYSFAVDAIEPLADGSWQVAAGERTVRGRHVVNAAGGWGGQIGRLAGFDVPVVHSRRNIFATAEGVTSTFVPMTIDAATGVYLRSEGSRILIGGSRPDEVDGYNVHLDWDWLEGLVELGAHRFPWLLDVPLDRSASWAGTYENTPDHNAIVGPEPAAPTWVNACGLSGHGLMQAPEVGRIVSEQIADGRIVSHDAARLSIERFRSGRDRDEGVSLVF